MSSADVSEPPNPHRAALALLRRAITEVQELGTLSLPPDEFDEWTVGLMVEAERLEATVAEAISNADDRVHQRHYGHGTLNAHLAGRTRQPTAAIAPKRTIGCWVNAFPRFNDAWKGGVLTEAHVRELKKLDSRRTRMDLLRDQAMLIDYAQSLEFAEWCEALGYWLLHADPDGQLPKERADSYGLDFKTHANGDVEVSGILDPISGDALKTAVEFQSEKLFRREGEAGEPTRTIRKRNLDALMTLVARGHARKDGTEPIPLINIVMSEPVAEDLLTKAFDPNAPPLDTIELDYGDIDRRCETLRGAPLDPRRCLPLLLIGKLRRQVMGAKTREVSLDTRLFPAWMRNALLVESRGKCTTPGCDAPLGWLQADHDHPASRGGHTTFDNGMALCGPDNKRKRDR